MLKIIYVLECKDKKTGEQFFKVGVTKNGVSRRYGGKDGNSKSMPYSYKILVHSYYNTIEYPFIEKLIKENFKLYKPLKDFPGCNECYTDNDLIGFIKELIIEDIEVEKPKPYRNYKSTGRRYSA